MAAKNKTEKSKKTINLHTVVFDWKNYEQLKYFMSDRAKILPRKRTNLSPKNQRKLGVAIKHARHLGLLPYQAEI